MKKILVLFGVVLFASVALAVTPFGDEQLLKQFNDFQAKYNKKYTREEIGKRFGNFKESIARAARKNAKGGAQYGITKFSDLSPEEFASTILMTKKINPADNLEIRNRVGVKKSPLTFAANPNSYDWRDRGAVTAVKNQEQCGSCWAFSTTENVESMWILAGKATDSIAFAPQQIVDCDQSDDGCGGGNPPTAYDYLISAGGIESEADYPYTAEDGNCAFNAKDVEGSITNWQYACDWRDENTLQNNLVSWGPLSVCVDASNWQDYQSGVMTWEECAYINVLDHCVQLVGYNQTDSSNPYWMVRNSWGTDWGVDGYIWLQMWEDTCGITYEASSSVVGSK